MKKATAVILSLCLLTALFCACARTDKSPEPSAPVSEEPEVSAPVGDEAEPELSDELDIAPAVESVVFYLPNENADGLVTESHEIEITPENMVSKLTELGALPEGSELNSFELITEGESDKVNGDTVEHTVGQIVGAKVDMNADFAEGVRATGIAGETMILASLVNSLLDYYDIESLELTVDGAALETGHNVYEEPFTMYTFE